MASPLATAAFFVGLLALWESADAPGGRPVLLLAFQVGAAALTLGGGYAAFCAH